MKKNVLIYLFFLLPLVAYTQVFEFSGSDDGWKKLAKMTSQTNPTFLTLTTIAGDGSLKNPNVENPKSSFAVDADTYKWVGVTIRNKSAAGPTLLRFAYRKADDSGWVSKNAVMTTGDIIRMRKIPYVMFVGSNCSPI